MLWKTMLKKVLEKMPALIYGLWSLRVASQILDETRFKPARLAVIDLQVMRQ